jgi:hypothetical protein
MPPPLSQNISGEYLLHTTWVDVYVRRHDKRARSDCPNEASVKTTTLIFEDPVHTWYRWSFPAAASRRGGSSDAMLGSWVGY